MLSAMFTSLCWYLGNSWGFPPLLKFFGTTEDRPQAVTLCPYSTAGICLASFFFFSPLIKDTKLGRKGRPRWMKVSVLEKGCLHLDLSRGALTESLLAQSPQQKLHEVAAKAWTASTPSLGRRTDNCPLLMMPAGYRALEKLLWKKPQLHPTAFHTHVELRRFVCFKEQDSFSLSYK